MSAARRWTVMFALAASCSAPAIAQPPDVNTDIWGHWKIVKDVTPVGAISGMTAREVRGMMGKPLLVSADKFTFNGHSCAHPAYIRSTHATADYFYHEWRIDSQSMPLGPRVTVIETGCHYHDLYAITHDRLIVVNDGLFFEAVRLPK